MTYTKAQFWKCALQVNPAGYIAYRGTGHDMTEEKYNQELLKICQEEEIKVLGIADHGTVDAVDNIRQLMNRHGILVFPGFEIASSEKVHFVCLFSEKTTTVELNRYLGSLDLLDPENGIRPSRLSAEVLIKKVDDDLKGFIYAAHCTADSGLLRKRFHHVWKNSSLKAAQIPSTIEALKSVESGFYRKVILNKEPSYQREQKIAIINAKDVEKPETLRDPKASCLIKMTKPCFDSFKLAFQDAESRVKLNSDVIEKYYSRIESMQVTGGYLDGVNIVFSEHLNTVIGGRGTGKSTLLECIRFALDLPCIGKNALKQHTEIIKENLKNKARVELKIRSSKMNGKKFTIARRYGESAIVKDENDMISPFSPADLLPEIELYGQNEILEIAEDRDLQRKLLTRFLDSGQTESERKIKAVGKALVENRKSLVNAMSKVASTEDELALLPKLEEQVDQFKSLGLENKLKIVPLLEAEKLLLERVSEEELKNLEDAFTAIVDVLPDTVFLSDKALGTLPHVTLLQQIRTELDKLKSETEAVLQGWQDKFVTSKDVINAYIKALNNDIKAEEEKLEKTFKELPASEGKSGREIGLEFQKLLQKIEKIKPKQILAKNQTAVVEAFNIKRKGLLAELSEQRATRSSQFTRALKKLNKKLDGKLKFTPMAESDGKTVIDFLMQCNMEGVGTKRLAWVNDRDDFSPVTLAELIRTGVEALVGCGWGITPTTANALVKLTSTQILQLEELELLDINIIELNIAHEGEENFRILEKLSTGQKCTAILHLLLLKNKDPLIMDQPEDNLDNAFIADRIVTELRSAKISRQFIFATHNANIPVFGDAEWIGVFDSFEGQAHMPDEAQGAIDVPVVRKKAANILEGGKTAFNQRKVKYGY